ncbi:zinc ABC transporter substrate-binding protein [Paenibacillus sp. CGMCC 1.16610]|uniref:Zinc ABC transporter solute-binding protein n=1 Tax=Paenibacillus anseongense TaxID=2682845 RepID=A0ABW9UE55_9BACL|nr:MULTISPECIES: metal ABC transporter substrate-binding protein [Paenibacillus]MBA2941955.1 zinc ABC transporter substrate-binding protein [Paenibacillus sp. CGMCC 1.16610]MVQ38442.1 zinc ABC transporter solute-binding protein [Paenibacillus anseongense]
MKNSWMAKSLVFTAVSTLILSGCAAQSSGTGKLNVVTTFYPMYEFTKQVAGEHADVIALIPAGSEPHDWEPSAKDMKKVSDADVFVFNGIVEGWAEQALASAGNSKRVVVEASRGIALMEGLPEEEEEHKDEHKESADGKILDPHVWLSPALAQKEVESIVAGLTQADPAHKEDYRRNADAFIAKLKTLDESFRTGLNNVKQKDFVTQHAAFGYLAKEYGLTQVPIAGLSPEEEPSPAKMAEIIDFAKQNQVKTIFFETLVDPKVAQTISKEINAKTDVLNPLEGLTDEDKKQNLDYIAIMTKNLEALKKALNE